MRRRQALLTALASCLPLQAATPVRLLVRSSWQTVNIGDIAHTPGLLALLEQHFPQAEVRLWPSKVDRGVDAMLQSRFPKLIILRGEKDVARAMQECDFFLHGSGPSLVAEKDVRRWHEQTGKPFGVFGITLPLQGSTATKPAAAEVVAKTIDLLGKARFVFFRDSTSLKLAQSRACACPQMAFGPDAAFACDLRDEERAKAYLAANQLQEGQFLCALVRLRFSPYWEMKPGTAHDPIKQARNDAMKEHDLGPIRQAIIEVLKQTQLKVLLCPEDSSQMKLHREMILEKLPAELRNRVVWREQYWLPGEALSVYRRSAGMFGAEMHSPIMAVGHGIPAIVCRWAEQTSKGHMWRDIGLGDWLMDMDVEQEVARVVPTVLAMALDPKAAAERAQQARAKVAQLQAQGIAQVRQACGA